MMVEKDSSKWSPVKKKLASMSKTELVDLVKDLFDYSAENRSFLTARFGSAEAALETYRKRVVDPFYPKRGFGKLNFVDARRAIREYRKASEDLTGTLDLMLTYVESGTRFTNEFGDIDERFYDSLESVLNEAIKLFKTPKGKETYPLFRKRLLKLAEEAEDIGWGYGDCVMEGVEELDEHLMGEEEQ